MLSSCNPVKYVSEGKYLLDDYTLKRDNKKINIDDLKMYVRQKPNKRIVGVKAHLWMYNRSSIKKNNENSFLRKIGEAPVIYNPVLVQKTTKQLNLYLNNKGYYNAIVTDTTIFKEKKKLAKVIYTIQTKEPYKISKINYFFEDSSIQELVLEDTSASILKMGDNFDVDNLQLERSRIERNMKNKGYYNFSKDYVYFQIDSSLNSNSLDLSLRVKKYILETPTGKTITAAHKKYKIKNLYFFTDYDAQKSLENKEEYFSDLDTIIVNDDYFICKNSYPVKPKSLLQYVYIKKGDLYAINNVERTYNHLNSLKVFKLINMQFHETGETNDNGEYLLDCFIQLSPFISQSFTVELEGTNSENIGGGALATYSNKNLFHGAEQFDIKIRGSLQAISEATNNLVDKKEELGAEASIQTPKYLLPFNTERFVKKFHPKTSLLMSYNFQKRPDYTRKIINSSFGYNWKGNKYLTHIVKPIELNAVNSAFSTDSIESLYKDDYRWYSFQSHFIANSAYSVIYTNQKISKSNRDFFYLRWNIESAGNILNEGFNLFNYKRNINDRYEVFGTEFSQYLRTDIDYRYYQKLNSTDKMVYRFFLGGGLPYKNSIAMPYERKYFSGGASSMRAWHARSLGPGTLEPDKSFKYYNNTGDIKLEMNLEYRFQLFWKVEAALFSDVGNVWEIVQDQDRPGAFFQINTFYNQMAIDMGVGARFDFDFFIFRIDWAFKARDPSYVDGNQWVFNNRKLGSNDHAINIGIGYPF